MELLIRLLVTTALSALVVGPAFAADAANTSDERARADIIVTGARSKQANLNESGSATGLDLSLKRPPNR